MSNNLGAARGGGRFSGRGRAGPPQRYTNRGQILNIGAYLPSCLTVIGLLSTLTPLTTNGLSVRIMSVNRSLVLNMDSPAQLSKQMHLGPYSSASLYMSVCNMSLSNILSTVGCNKLICLSFNCLSLILFMSPHVKSLWAKLRW